MAPRRGRAASTAAPKKAPATRKAPAAKATKPATKRAVAKGKNKRPSPGSESETEETAKSESRKRKKTSVEDESNDESNDESAESDAPKASPRKAAKTTKGASKAASDKLPAPEFAGKLDLYAAALPFLAKVYLPAGSSDPQYEELYKTILTYQAKPDNSGQFFLPKSATSSGRFLSLSVANPMSDEPYEINLESIKHKDKMTFTEDEREEFDTPGPNPPGPGITAKVVPGEEGCGVAFGSGIFKMTRVWAKRTSSGETQELFEGYFSYDIRFSVMMIGKGFGREIGFTMPFWAVRARKDEDGNEIGLEGLEESEESEED